MEVMSTSVGAVEWSEASSQRVAHHKRVIAATQELVRMRLHALLLSDSPLLPIPPLISLIAAYAVVPLTVTTIGGAGMNDLTTLHARGKRADGKAPPPPISEFVSGETVMAYWSRFQPQAYSSRVRGVNPLHMVIIHGGGAIAPTIHPLTAESDPDAWDELHTWGGNRLISCDVMYADGDVDRLCPERNLQHTLPRALSAPRPEPVRVYNPMECVLYRPTPLAAGGECDSYLVYTDQRENALVSINLRTFESNILLSGDSQFGMVRPAKDRLQKEAAAALKRDGPYGLCIDQSTGGGGALLVTSLFQNEIRRITVSASGSASAGGERLKADGVQTIWSSKLEFKPRICSSVYPNGDGIGTRLMQHLAGVVTTTAAAPNSKRYAYFAQPNRFAISRLELLPPAAAAKNGTSASAAAPTAEVVVTDTTSLESEKRILSVIERGESQGMKLDTINESVVSDVNWLWQPAGLVWDRFTPEPESALFITSLNLPHLRRLELSTGRLHTIPIAVPPPPPDTIKPPPNAVVVPARAAGAAAPAGVGAAIGGVSAAPTAHSQWLKISRAVSIARDKLLVTGFDSPGHTRYGVFVVDLIRRTSVLVSGCRQPQNRIGYANGTVAAGAEAASFCSPLGLAYGRNVEPDGTDCIYLCDSDNGALRCISGSIDWQIAATSTAPAANGADAATAAVALPQAAAVASTFG